MTIKIASIRIVVSLDCQPGNPRPGDLIDGVIAGLGLSDGHPEPVSKLMGDWTYHFFVPTEEAADAVRDVLAERIKALYNAGTIRYGSW